MNPAKIAIWIFLPGLLFACGPAQSEPALVLVDGWIRAMPPGGGMTAAYGNLINQGTQTIDLTGFQSDSYEDISLHVTTIEGGVSRMKQLPGWQLDPGTTMVLEPGGYHLMLMQPTREIHAGDHVRLALTAADGEKFEFSLPVEAR